MLYIMINFLLIILKFYINVKYANSLKVSLFLSVIASQYQKHYNTCMHACYTGVSHVRLCNPPAL